MKTILTFILALVPCVAFAGDFIFAPVISKPPSTGNGLDSVDSYVISGDKGTEVVHVMSLDPVAKDSYLVVGPNGKSNVVIKFDQLAIRAPGLGREGLKNIYPGHHASPLGVLNVSKWYIQSPLTQRPEGDIPPLDHPLIGSKLLDIGSKPSPIKP